MHTESCQKDSRRLVRTATPGIYKRGGRYVVTYRDPQGRQRKRYAATIGEARDLKAALRADVARGEFRALSRVTFAEYAPQWIAGYQGRTARGLRDSTRADYRRALGLGEDGEPLTGKDGRPLGAVAFFGRMRLAEIEPRDVKRYAAQVAETGVSANTVRLAVAPVRALLATAVEEGLIRSNPAAGLRLAVTAKADENGGRVKALTEDELRSLLGHVADRYRLLVEFLATTGLRISEARALRWSDLDLGHRRVRVRRSVYRGQVGPPKTRFGLRDVPISEALARELWSARKALGAAASDDEALVFGDHDYGAVFRAVKAAAKKAGVPWAGLHTLRHTCASILFRRGLNAKQVQAWLGHPAASFTLDTYVHLLDAELPDPSFFDEVRGNNGATRPPEKARDARAGEGRAKAV
jgi:integrase